MTLEIHITETVHVADLIKSVWKILKRLATKFWTFSVTIIDSVFTSLWVTRGPPSGFTNDKSGLGGSFGQ